MLSKFRCDVSVKNANGLIVSLVVCGFDARVINLGYEEAVKPF